MLYHTCFCSSGSQHNIKPRSCLEYNVKTSIVYYELKKQEKFLCQVSTVDSTQTD